MSAIRKNARRLRDLRRVGVPIDGDYHVSGAVLERLNVLDLAGPPVDRARDLYRVPTNMQRAILRGLS